MPRQIVKNPKTGNYNIYSSICDAFYFDEELTKEELTEFWIGDNGENSRERLEEILVELDKPNNLAYGRHTMTYAEANMWHVHQAVHGIKNRKSESCGICKDILSDEEK